MIKLTPRLMTAVPFVRRGHLLCDVGTDHAYLPIFLCQSGILTPVRTADGSRLCAIASDINEGPVDRATVHIAAAGLSDRIRTIRTDGLHGLEDYHPTDIILFGMGGELIVSVLQAAPWVRDPAIRLILQPMTHPEKLRRFLFENGFSLVGEVLSREELSRRETRIYQTICAAYCPEKLPPPDVLRPACLLTGSHYPADMTQDLLTLIRRSIQTHTLSRDARAAAGLDVTDEDALLRDLAMQEAELTAPCAAPCTAHSAESDP